MAGPAAAEATAAGANANPPVPPASNFATQRVAEGVDEGVIILDDRLYLSRLDVAPSNRLFPAGKDLVGRLVWEAFQGEMRVPLRGAYKKIMAGEDHAAWEIGAPADGVLYTFRLSRIEEGYSITFRGVSVPTTSTLPAIIVNPSPPLPGEGPHDFFAVSPDVTCILDERGRLVRINPAAERLLKLAQGDVPGLPLTDVVHPEEREKMQGVLDAAVRTPSSSDTQTVVCRCHCHPEREGGDPYRWLGWRVSTRPVGDAIWLYATARDETEARAREADLRWHVDHDKLTGLPNRTLLLSLIREKVASARRWGYAVAVLFIDLDGFKRINDTHLHDAGDQLLVEIARRLRDGLREEDTVARLAGDEFVAVLPNIRDHNDAVNVAEKLLQRIAHPVTFAEHRLCVTGSIGISLYPNDGATGEALLHNADLAMYRAKKAGPGRFALYEKGTGKIRRERLALESRLSQAFERRELLLHYQPQISLTTGQVVGVEALMRWHHDEIGHIPPDDFIPVAEETGLIGPMGQWAVEEACRQAMDWRHAGFPVRISVNLSPSQLTDDHFPEHLEKYLRRIGLPPQQMDLELTERVFIQEERRMIDTLARLKEMGVRLSVDDFGTKFAIFSSLRRLPIDGIKVDRSFVATMDTNPADAAVVKAIIDLAHTLGLRVVAEGVETPEQRDKLLQMECDVMQGHLFSAAMSPRDVTSLLAHRRAPNGR